MKIIPYKKKECPGLMVAAASVRDEVLETSEILAEILKHLNVDDLKSCSVVSKRWNIIVRSYMQDHRNIVASYKTKKKNDVKSCPPPCVQLKLLNQTLTKWTPSSVIPFTGIMIDLGHGIDRVPGPSYPKCEEYIDTNFSKLIKSIPLRRLVVTNSGHHLNMSHSCPVISFLRRWISIQDEGMEEVELINLPYVVCKKFVKIGELQMFALKKLKLNLNFSDSSFERKLLNTFCANAPNLKKLQAPVDEKTLAFLRESSYGRIEQFSLGEIPDNSVKECLLSLAKQKPALRHLDLSFFPATTELFTTFKLVCQHLLKCSQSSLENLSIEILDDQSFLSVFQDLYLHPMETIESLRFSIVHRSATTGEVDWIPLLDGFNFSCFPCVRDIRICDDNSRMYYSTGTYYDIAEPHPSPALSATSLHLQIVLRNVEVAFFQRIFPNIKTLYYDCCWVDSPFAEIWAHWPDLEELAIDLQHEWVYNWDAEICGIFQDEVDFLRQQSTEYLRAVHIVPVQPALTSMTEMETLRIEIHARDRAIPWRGTELFSKVTCHLALERMENLTITVNCAESARTLSALIRHMKQHKRLLFTSETSQLRQ